jgi:hypothetical protein
MEAAMKCGAGLRQYTIDVRTWKTGADVAADSFKAEIPPGVKTRRRR